MTVFDSYGQAAPADLLSPHRWQHRLLLIFSPDRENAQLQQQLALADTYAQGYAERDLQTFVFTPDGGTLPDGSPLSQAIAQAYYQRYAVESRQFATLLIGKDGGEKLRRTQATLGPDLLFATIDAMPMRQREMREQTH